MPKKIATYNVPPGKWDTAKVAKYLEFSEAYISELTKSGKLKAEKFSGSSNKNWYCPEEIKEFKKQLNKMRKA